MNGRTGKTGEIVSDISHVLPVPDSDIVCAAAVSQEKESMCSKFITVSYCTISAVCEGTIAVMSPVTSKYNRNRNISYDTY